MKKNRKLNLDRETIRPLAQLELQNVGGGFGSLACTGGLATNGTLCETACYQCGPKLQ